MDNYDDLTDLKFNITKLRALSFIDSNKIQEEETEKLEQLRWLKAGWDIGCTRVDFNGVEINTQEDILLWNYKNNA